MRPDELIPAQAGQASFEEACRADMLAARDAAGIPDVDPAEWALLPGEPVAKWHERIIELYGGHLALMVPAKRAEDVVSIDLGTLRRRDRERLLARRPGQARRHVLLLLRPPACLGARLRTAPRARGRRSRRAAARGCTRGSPGDDGEPEPPGDRAAALLVEAAR